MSSALPETHVLKARDPAIDDNTDEWPEFVLTNVHVYRPDDRDAPVSLLAAAAGYPLSVEGQLEPLDDEDAHLYEQVLSKRRIKIVLEDVKMFSYGQYGDGSTAIWAAGRAGWFTIKPGRSYRDIYSDMVDAVNMLYYITDKYREPEPRRRGKGKAATTIPEYTAQELFAKYAAEELGSSDASEAVDKFHDHKDFIISSMLAGKEGLAWSKLPIYRHFYNKFPDTFAMLRGRLESRPTKDPEDREQEPLSSSRMKHKRNGSVESTSTTSTTRRRGRPPKHSRGSIPIGDHSEFGVAVCDSLVKGMSEDSDLSGTNPPSRKQFSRRTRKYPVSEPTPVSETPIATPTRDDDTDEETELRARKNKSSLRPRPSNAAKSTARKSGKGLPIEDDDEPDPRSSPIAGKRKYPEDLDIRPAPKRRDSRPHDDEGIDIPTSPSLSGDADEGIIGGTSELTLRTLGHVPDPVQEDTWVCALDGCNHKVYAASNSDSQRLIKEHYALHAYDDDERVQMVKKMQAPSLPASHLMERVKMQAKQEGFPDSVSRQMASRYPAKLPALSLGITQRY